MAERSPGRVVPAVVVGIALSAALLAWAIVMPPPASSSRYCGEYTGCFGYFVLLLETGRWVALVAAWPLLRLLGVRPSWPVALLAALYAATIWRLAEALLRVDLEGGLLLFLLSGALAYPAAAWLATPRVPGRVRAYGVALAAVLHALATFALGGN